jgi:hypothetical protein
MGVIKMKRELAGLEICCRYNFSKGFEGYEHDVRASEKDGKLCIFYDNVIIRIDPVSTEPSGHMKSVCNGKIQAVARSGKKVYVNLITSDYEKFQSGIVGKTEKNGFPSHETNFQLEEIPADFYDRYLTIDI